MKSLIRLAAAVGVAALLAGCGAPGAMPQAMQTSASAQSHQGSWMKPGSGSGDLMYVAARKNEVLVFSFPQGDQVGRLAVSAQPWGLCSDSSGNVFVTEDNGTVVEYAHGGTSAINTLYAQRAFACSSDPSTGNLAVVERLNSIAIFTDASGTAKRYTNYFFATVNYCAYDDKGNLYFDGSIFNPIGPYTYGLEKFSAGKFSIIKLNKGLYFMGDLQWDGKYLALDDFYRTAEIYRVRVSGRTGTIERTTSLDGTLYDVFSWLQNGTFISPTYAAGKKEKQTGVDFWSYPSGGKPAKEFPEKHFNSKGSIHGVTVSVAPSSMRTGR